MKNTLPDATPVPSRNSGERAVVGNMATMPERLHCLNRALGAILPQLDQLNLYLNNFPRTFNLYEHYPELEAYSHVIQITSSRDIGDRRDHARFTDALEYGHGHYYVCVDDDIVYPADYIERLAGRSETYHDKVALCVHGYGLWENLQDFTRDRARASRYFHFEHELASDALVDVAGIGTLFCPAELIEEDFSSPPYGFSDLVVAKYLFTRSIPVVAIRRQKSWLNGIPNKSTLYDEARSENNDAKLYARELAGVMNNSSREYCTTLLDLNQAPEEMVRSDTALCLPDDIDRHEIYICISGANCGTTIKAVCIALRKALVNLLSRRVNICFLDDGSHDEIERQIATHAFTHLSRYRISTFRNDVSQGPACSRATLVNEARKKTGRKLFCMLDLDRTVTPVLGRLLHAIVMQGYHQALYSTTGQAPDTIIWWEESSTLMDIKTLRNARNRRGSRSHEGFLDALLDTLPGYCRKELRYKLAAAPSPFHRQQRKLRQVLRGLLGKSRK
ncbi:glycosyltransferase [Prosthecochloris sp. ZM_2]|uniref:glycosyltransferase n=1 Tax=Prosthecochloris sp. ZM_2 TaxID=2045206 RepID=UPI0011CDCAA7|nr:glycosyltransferase [Prosthecochloris sp. ZM_2]